MKSHFVTEMNWCALCCCKHFKWLELWWVYKIMFILGYIKLVHDSTIMSQYSLLRHPFQCNLWNTLLKFGHYVTKYSVLLWRIYCLHDYVDSINVQFNITSNLHPAKTLCNCWHTNTNSGMTCILHTKFQNLDIINKY